MCFISVRVTFHCQILYFGLCSSINSWCVKFVLHEEHNVALQHFSPQSRILPKTNDCTEQACQTPVSPPSDTPNTFQTAFCLGQLSDISSYCSPRTCYPTSGRPGRVCGCRAHIGRTWNPTEPHLFTQQPAQQRPHSWEKSSIVA